MKKMLSVFLFFAALSVLTIPISAQADITTPPAIEMDVPALEPDVFVSESIISPFEINVFASLVNDGTYAINPQTVEVLYDLSGNPSFLIADVMPYGFAIMFRDAAEISELNVSEGAVSPYLMARGRKIYAGPSGHCSLCCCRVSFNVRSGDRKSLTIQRRLLRRDGATVCRIGTLARDGVRRCRLVTRA